MSEARHPARLTASTRILLEDSRAILDGLCAHLAEHVPVERFEGGARLTSDYGTAQAEVLDDALAIAIDSADAAGLSFLKLIVADHILALADGQKPVIRWSGDGKAGEPLPYFREMRVLSASNVTPLMRRVVLAGHDLGRFANGGLHVRLLFPPPGAETPQWPVSGEDGRPQWPEGAAKPAARVYTIRSIDAEKGEVVVDMVLHASPGGDPDHDHAPGAAFALRAKAGDVVGMTGPGGGSIGEARRYILLGDETALPAIGRLLETMPAEAEVAAFVEVADASEEQALPCPARLDLRWLHRHGAGAGGTDLLEKALRQHPWLRDGGDTPFVWTGCEHAQTRAIKQFLLKEEGLPREKYQVAAYWRRGANGDDTRRD
ncbi:DUF2218 domain-containing protein [Pseudochelatococcus lubricantis]|uniref:DUF2218 domain-containing protein n=1 Tax=Pseudochelatococcus lubricantis TaxID=1538102 RepID=UPI0035F09DC7